MHPESSPINLSIFSFIIILKYGVSVTHFDFADVDYLTAMYGWIVVRVVIANMLRLKEHPVVVIALMMLLGAHVVIILRPIVIRHIGSIYWHHYAWAMHLVWHRHHPWLPVIWYESYWHWIAFKKLLVRLFQFFSWLFRCIHYYFKVYLL